jgi:hypothetical protein
VEATTYSEGLANDLMHLLLQLGVVASVHSNTADKSTRFRVCFRGAENIEKFKEIGFMDSKRNNLIKN